MCLIVLLWQKYVVEAGALQQVGLSGRTFSGDLGLFLDSLDQILTELVEPASEDLGIDDRGPTAPRSFQDKDLPLVGC